MFEEFEDELSGGGPQGLGWVEPEAFDPSPPPQGNVVLSGFAPSSAQMLPAHRQIIETVARRLRDVIRNLSAMHTLIIVVEGHEDETGDPSHFRRFGRERAMAVAKALEVRLKALVAQLPPGPRPRVLFRVNTLGPQKPIRSNVTSRGRAMNRRAEIRVQIIAPRFI